MSYIDAQHDKERDLITVIERGQDGVRRSMEYPANYTFYYKDDKGKYRSIYGDSLSRFSTRKRTEFQKELKLMHKRGIFESDTNIVFRCLADNYLDKSVPKLHTVFFDIETDFDPEKGFSPTSDPFNPVTAISLYLDWLGQLVTLAIPPKHMSWETAQDIIKDFDNTFIFDNEVDMFNAFFDLITDGDVLTGWNSEGYDIPYMVNRITRVMSKDDTRRFCLNGHLPRARKYERFGKEETTYDLVGRIHLDYLQLYKKYNYEQRHSYKLDTIGELEVGEKKTQYEGTLDQLYNKDWRKFLEYNRQDTLLLFKIHDKLKFLDLANEIAHENTVLLPTVMGSVAMIEQAIINEAHSRGLIVQDKIRKGNDDDETTAAGAYVATPKRGIHEWVAAVDINSLYPSVIRALNMAPETIIGQLRPIITDQYMADKKAKLALGKGGKGGKRSKKTAEDITGPILWEGLFGSLEYTAVMNQERGTMITIDWERGGSDQASAAEIWKMIFDSNQPWMLTANGTIFTYEQEGVIPGLLTRWYSERKQVQAKLKQATTKEEIEFLDKRQLVKKILLNSAYGALLNAHCRFYDIRIGQSTTLNGRQIVKHMSGHLNQSITGIYDHTGDAIVYGDTDSCYFSVWPMIKQQVANNELEWSKEHAISIYDNIADQTNASFPEFMEKAFHCPRKNGEIIKAGRELIGDRAIFITKKRYAINIFDKDGKRKDKDGKTGQIKAMGLDLKRSDTPKFIQVFLMTILESVLAGGQKDEIVSKVKEFKHILRDMDSWTKGSPKSVNNLTMYANKAQAAGKKLKNKLFVEDDESGDTGMPGHVRASLNWNYLRKLHGDNYSQQVVDGMRIVVCKLKDNPLGFTSVAYPTDELRLPQWFLELPFDDVEMERVLVDEKIDNLLGVMNWNLRISTNISTTASDLFDFG
jgi:DNA polymerase elongation subunit (family B)